MSAGDTTGPQEPFEAEERGFRLLEEYVAALQSGQSPDKQRLLRECPELAPAADCLELLERFAVVHAPPQLTPLPSPSQASELPTLLGKEPAPPSSDGGGQAVPSVGQFREFGHYELIQEIGRGGMGVVFKARQKSLERLVAIKMVARHLTSQEHIRRFQTEAKAAAASSHPHIVHIHEVGELFGQHYLVMEYIAGESLAARLQRRPLEFDAAARLVCSVAQAVHHLHQHGIIHRDLKPSNILLDARDQPYVTDFGLAKLHASDSKLTASGAIAGTPSYMSPEQAAGRNNEVGPASDVYSLGTILYELLTGRPPFESNNPLDTLVQVQEREPPLPRRLNPKVPWELELICLKCLEKSPAQRYASAQALADDLERYLRGEGIEARAPKVPQRLLRWARREPALATHVLGISVFYGVELLNYYNQVVEPTFHIRVSVVLAVWVIASFFFQRLLAQPGFALPAQFAWGAVDVLSLLAVLLIADGVASPMVIGFPLLIVASGLWGYQRLVWFVTATASVAYLLLVADFYLQFTKPRPEFDTEYDRHVYFTLGLLICGSIVAWMVSRVKALTRYFEQRRN